MMVALHTPGVGARYLRAPLEAIEPVLTLDYDDGDWLSQIDAIPVEKFHLFGHGLGGFLARRFAALHPERVEKLILCSTAVSLDWLGSRLAWARRALATLDDATLARWFRNLLPVGFANRERAMPELFEGFDAAKLLRALSLEESWTPPVDTLIVHGRWDWLIRVEEGHRLMEESNDSELIVLERSGHFPFLEQPGPFVLVVEAFLRGTRMQPSALGC
jgi:3-oxoadipate enol-lactonase